MEELARSRLDRLFDAGVGSSTSYQAYFVLIAGGFLAYQALRLLGYFPAKNCFNVAEKTAIITGSSQGLGLAVAKHLASKGANVVIVAQDVPKLQAALEQIKHAAKRPTQRFLCLSFDLRSPTSARQILSQVTEWNHDIPASIIWSCAGRCIPGFFADTSIDALRGQMDTIYWSAAYMAHATLNSWLGSSPNSSEGPSTQRSSIGSRHLIFTSSTLAFFPLAGYAPYTPAKAAMKSLSDTLVQEVAMHNTHYNARFQIPASSHSSMDIKIHTLFPMGILTPGYENETKLKPPLTMMLEKGDKPQHPDEVARIAVERLERGDYLITTMFLGHLMRGMGMGASLRNGGVDLLWIAVGNIAALFAVPDFVEKCRKWGKENVDRKEN